MAHHHEHESDTYYVDQLCMIGLSGAFAGICLSLYFWNRPMLDLVLAPQLQLFVAISGGMLLLITLLRAFSLFMEPSPQPHVHDHAPAEEHDCADCGHDHPPGHEHHHHDHGHEHPSHASHSHADHSHADHDHGWAPWRYVVLLVPVILFLLGLPNKGPAVTTSGFDATGLEFGSMKMDAATDADIQTSDYKVLVGWSQSQESRDLYQGKWVRVKGQFSPNINNEKIFSLVRFRIQCCGADAIRLDVPILSPVSVSSWKTGTWVDVRGKVDFVERNGRYQTILRIPGLEAIQETPGAGYLW